MTLAKNPTINSVFFGTQNSDNSSSENCTHHSSILTSNQVVVVHLNPTVDGRLLSFGHSHRLDVRESRSTPSTELFFGPFERSIFIFSAIFWYCMITRQLIVKKMSINYAGNSKNKFRWAIFEGLSKLGKVFSFSTCRKRKILCKKKYMAHPNFKPMQVTTFEHSKDRLWTPTIFRLL
jgi:hypothetical protein